MIDRVIADVGQNPVRAEDLERVKTQLIAEAIYAQDNQATLARWYGGALTTGLSIEDIRSWPDRIRAVTAEQVRDAAQKWLDKKRSVTGYLIKDTSAEARGEAFVSNLMIFTRRFVLLAAAGLALAPLASTPSHAAAKIQHLVSPGGIEAWFVQDATVPLIAMEYAFAGGATQDPADKPGVGNLVADLLDEGSGDLDSKTFHERLDRRAIELSFSSTRDYFRGSLRMLKDNRDEAFDLLRMSLTSPHFDSADVERIRSQVISELRRDTTNPSALAGRKFLEIAFGDHPYGRQANGTLESVPKIDDRRSEGLCPPRAGQGYAEDRRGRRCRSGHARRAARQDLRRTAGQGQPDAGPRRRSRQAAAARLHSARRAADRGDLRRSRLQAPRSEFHGRLCRQPHSRRRRAVVAALSRSPREARSGLFGL